MFNKDQIAYESKKYGKRNGETAHSRRAGVRGRVKYRSCEHGSVLIDDYMPTGKRCEGCEKKRPRLYGKAPYAVKNDPFFNFGLGCVTENTRHAEKIAKQRGLQPMGDQDLSPFDYMGQDDGEPMITKEDIDKARSEQHA